MDSNQPVSPPSQPVGPSAQPRVVGDRELYAQITASDTEVMAEPKQKKTAPLISFMAVFMKITFQLDEFRHAHERLFILLKTLWMAMMSVLYLSGVVMLCLSVFSFMRLPVYLKGYLEDRGIQYDTLEMGDYSFSELNITNLRDTNNTYQIPEIKVHSTFADFLQNRIRLVEARGLQINLKSDVNSVLNDIESFVKIVKTFDNPKDTGLDLTINALQLQDAVFNIPWIGRNIPISFSLSGVYTGTNQVILPFFINEDFLKLDARLLADGSANQRKISIKIDSGTVVFPQMTPEKCSGEINLETTQGNISKIQADIQLKKSSETKNIRLNLTANKSKTFDGSLLFSHSNNMGEMVADMTLGVKELDVTKGGVLSTIKPLTVDMRKWIQGDFSITNLRTTLNGQLNCTLTEGKCDYALQKDTDVNLESLEFDLAGGLVQLNNNPVFHIKKSSQKVLVLQLNNPPLQLNLPLSKLDVQALDDQTPVTLKAKQADLDLRMAQSIADSYLKFKLDNADFQTDGLTLKSAQLNLDNVFDDTASMHLSVEKMETSSPLLKKPAQVNLTKVGQKTSVSLRVLDTNLIISAQGILDVFQKTFNGQFNLLPLDLASLSGTLADITSLFPANIQNMSGQMAASGQIKYAGENSIEGPMYVAFKDARFTWHQMEFINLNTALRLQSLVPFVSDNNQRIFIGNIDTLIPISNVLIAFQMNPNALRLSGISAQIAGQNAMTSTSVINLKNPNTVLNLKTNNNIDLKPLAPYLNWDGLTLKEGTGTIALPIQITPEGVNISALTFMLYNTKLNATGGRDIFGLIQAPYTDYEVRTGQLTYNTDKNLTVDFDGWYAPGRVKQTFGPKNITLPNGLFQKSPDQKIPVDITALHSKLFQTEVK